MKILSNPMRISKFSQVAEYLSPRNFGARQNQNILGVSTRRDLFKSEEFFLLPPLFKKFLGVKDRGFRLFSDRPMCTSLSTADGCLQDVQVKGTDSQSSSTYSLEIIGPVRTFACPYAQRVCWVRGNGCCAQARQDRCSSRRERATNALIIGVNRGAIVRKGAYGRLVFKITS